MRLCPICSSYVVLPDWFKDVVVVLTTSACKSVDSDLVTNLSFRTLSQNGHSAQLSLSAGAFYLSFFRILSVQFLYFLLHIPQDLLSSASFFSSPTVHLPSFLFGRPVVLLNLQPEEHHYPFDSLHFILV